MSVACPVQTLGICNVHLPAFSMRFAASKDARSVRQRLVEPFFQERLMRHLHGLLGAQDALYRLASRAALSVGPAAYPLGYVLIDPYV